MLSARVKMAHGIVYQLAYGHMIQSDGHIGGVIHLPNLKILPNALIAHQIIGHVHPCLRTAGQAMHHQQNAPIWVVRLHQKHMRLLYAALAPKQGAQRLLGKARIGQPHPIRPRKIRRQRHLLLIHHHLVVAKWVKALYHQFLRVQYLIQSIAFETD